MAKAKREPLVIEPLPPRGWLVISPDMSGIHKLIQWLRRIHGFDPHLRQLPMRPAAARGIRRAAIQVPWGGQCDHNFECIPCGALATPGAGRRHQRGFAERIVSEHSLLRRFGPPTLLLIPYGTMRPLDPLNGSKS